MICTSPRPPLPPEPEVAVSRDAPPPPPPPPGRPPAPPDPPLPAALAPPAPAAGTEAAIEILALARASGIAARSAAGAAFGTPSDAADEVAEAAIATGIGDARGLKRATWTSCAGAVALRSIGWRHRGQHRGLAGIAGLHAEAAGCDPCDLRTGAADAAGAAAGIKYVGASARDLRVAARRSGIATAVAGDAGTASAACANGDGERCVESIDIEDLIGASARTAALAAQARRCTGCPRRRHRHRRRHRCKRCVIASPRRERRKYHSR